MPSQLLAVVLITIYSIDLQAVCATLLDRHLDASSCQGGISYPGRTLRDAMADTTARIQRYHYLKVYSIAAGLSLAPFLLRSGRIPLSASATVAFACAWAFSAPLFATATDWGRLCTST